MGRHPDCDIVVDVGAVSRQHAKIVHQGDAYFVEDLKSRNGTFLNEQMIQGRHRLGHGDRVRVCDVTFVFQAREPGEIPTEESPGKSRSGFGAVLVDDGSTLAPRCSAARASSARTQSPSRVIPTTSSS